MNSIPGESEAPAGEAPTVSHLLGEMTWLLSQSPLHRHLAIGDLEWLIMPPLIHRQFYVFRDGSKPIGLALWANCGPEAEAKLEGGMALPENRLTLEDWNSGETAWLVELVAPFQDAQNGHRDLMIADLVSGPLEGRAFKFHETDLATGRRAVKTVAGDAGEKLRGAVLEVLEGR
ncbi:MAG: cytolysin-activating lysine-acyltransferase [Sphingomonadales bacterium]|nr:cytolysin-activating lysine-acyltransferase [Sphingomonadales bacterium]